MTTPLTLRVRTHAGDTTSPVPLTMEQVDDNFIALKDGIEVVAQDVSVLSNQIINIPQQANEDAVAMAIALG